jgi:hypothetical protein
MNNTNVIETKNKLAKIYITLAAVFIGIFSTITILSLFVSALNF